MKVHARTVREDGGGDEHLEDDEEALRGGARRDVAVADGAHGDDGEVVGRDVDVERRLGAVVIVGAKVAVHPRQLAVLCM